MLPVEQPENREGFLPALHGPCGQEKRGRKTAPSCRRSRMIQPTAVPVLLQQLQHTLRHLIGLGQHGLSGLNQDVVLGV